MRDIQERWELGTRQTRNYRRDLDRGRAAAARVRRAGGSAMEAARASIAAVFGPELEHGMFKDRVRSIMKRGLADPEIRSRYRNYIDRFPDGLEIGLALWLIDMETRYEKSLVATSIRLWSVNNRPRITLMILSELNLIFRLIRRKAVPKIVIHPGTSKRELHQWSREL